MLYDVGRRPIESYEREVVEVPGAAGSELRMDLNVTFHGDILPIATTGGDDVVERESRPRNAVDRGTRRTHAVGGGQDQLIGDQRPGAAATTAYPTNGLHLAHRHRGPSLEVVL